MNKTKERFWNKVKITDGCWNWTSSFLNNYGRFATNSKTVYAHRYAYESVIEKIPEGLELDHLCRNTACVNPLHLEPVTHRENIKRGFTGLHHLSKTHCPRGHPYDEKNTYRPPNGHRVCRNCGREAMKRWRAK